MQFYNTKITCYADGSRKAVYFKNAVLTKQYSFEKVESTEEEKQQKEHFKEVMKTWDELIKESQEEVEETIDWNKKVDNLDRSVRRTKSLLNDLFRNNKSKNMVFVTLTNNLITIQLKEGYKVDQINEDFKEHILKKLQNMVARQKIKYIMVIEKTEKGFYHFHGIIYDLDDSRLIDTGLKDRTGRKIYNLKDFEINGFNTATKVRSPEACFNYCSKYMSKDIANHKKGEKRYYHSNNITKPEYIYNYLDFDAFEDNEKSYENDEIIIYYY